MKEIDAENDGIGSPTEFGYLKSLGLDYGWGPTTMMEWVFEHIHIWTGSVWCLSIALTALAVRAVFVRAFIQASDMSAKMSALKPVTEPIMTKLRECQKTKDTAGVLKARTDVSAVYKRAEIKLWKPFVPLLQIFPSYGTFRLMRGMADVPVPGLETGGLLWFQDLTLPDPYLIIPLATGFILYRTIKVRDHGRPRTLRVHHLSMDSPSTRDPGVSTIANPPQQHGAEHNTSTFMTPFAYKIVSYVVPSFTFVIMNWWPATLQLYFLFAGGLAYLQQMAFRNAILRRWLRMTPMLPLVTTTTTTEASNVFPKLNLSPRLKAETSTTTTLDADSPALAGQTKAKKLVGGAVAEVKGMVTEVQKSWASATGSNPTRGVKRTESEKRQASAYEQRRRKELDRQQSDLKQAKWERWREKQEQMAQEEANKGL